MFNSTEYIIMRSLIENEIGAVERAINSKDYGCDLETEEGDQIYLRSLESSLKKIKADQATQNLHINRRIHD